MFSLQSLVVGPVAFTLHPLVDEHLLQFHLCPLQSSGQTQHGRRLPHPGLQVRDEVSGLAEDGGGHITCAGRKQKQQELKKKD